MPNSEHLESLTPSRPYSQDDLTWCVQKARYKPRILNFLLVVTPTVWLVQIFGIGYISGFLIYIMIQFDLDYRHRNQRDWHYTTWLISLPAVIGVNQRFQPKRFTLRIFYFFFLVNTFIGTQIFFFYVIQFVKIPIPYTQTSTVAEMIDSEFRLAGTREVYAFTMLDGRVS